MSALGDADRFFGLSEQPTLEDQELAADLLSERYSLVQKNKLFGFTPHAKQLDFISHDTVKRKIAAGGNRFGKTTIVSVESFCHSIGCRPYFPVDHPLFRVRMPNGSPIPVPNNGQMCGDDFPVGIGENLWPVFQEWVPADMYQVMKTERSIPRVIRVDISSFEWADVNWPTYPYSFIYVHAYQQGRRSFQGVKCHWVMDDEPPPRPVYTEQMRGLVDYGGKFMGAMTCIDAEDMWIYDLFVPPKHRSAEARAADEEAEVSHKASFYLVQGSMYDNLKQKDGSGGLSQENIEEYKKDLDEEMIAVRIHGEQRNLLNTEFAGAWGDHNVVPHRDPDPDAMFVVTCDAHPSKPYAIQFWEVNEYDQWYCWHESFDPQFNDHDAIAEAIKQIEGWRKNHLGEWVTGSGLAPAIRLIDPIAKTHEKGIGMTAIEYYRIEHHMLWTPWTKGDKISRTKMLRSWLKPGKGPSGEPKVTISENCETTVFQMPRYRLKPIKDETTQPTPTEFLDVNADLVQGPLAVANAGLTFEILEGMMPGRRGRVIPVYGAGVGSGPRHNNATYAPDEEREKDDWDERGELEDAWRQRAPRGEDWV